MLKTLKWVYSLGVRHERVRVAAHLKSLDSGMRIENDTMMDMLREQKPGKTRKQRLEFDLAVNNKVQDIVNQILRPEEHYEMGASLMFPEDEHKGKM